MDAVEFLKHKRRMCRLFAGSNCQGCPIIKLIDEYDTSCQWLMKKFPEQVIKTVELWSNANPSKTILDDFKSRNPNIKFLDCDCKTPRVCAADVGYNVDDCKGKSFNNCKLCWQTPIL